MLQTFPKAVCSRVLNYEISKPFDILWASLAAQMVKNLAAMQENQVRSLGQEDPMGKAMATHRSILA